MKANTLQIIFVFFSITILGFVIYTYSNFREMSVAPEASPLTQEVNEIETVSDEGAEEIAPIRYDESTHGGLFDEEEALPKIGDRMGEMVVSSIEPIHDNAPPSSDNAAIKLTEKIEVTGTYEYEWSDFDADSYYRMSDFDAATQARLPSSGGFYFEDEDVDEVVRMFGDGKVPKRITVFIDEYQLRKCACEAINRASLATDGN